MVPQIVLRQSKLPVSRLLLADVVAHEKELCAFWQKDFCQRGSYCGYAHGQQAAELDGRRLAGCGRGPDAEPGLIVKLTAECVHPEKNLMPTD